MSFDEHESQFAGKLVVPFERGGSLESLGSSIYSIRVENESDETITGLLTELLEDPAADRLTGLGFVPAG